MAKYRYFVALGQVEGSHSVGIIQGSENATFTLMEHEWLIWYGLFGHVYDEKQLKNNFLHMSEGSCHFSSKLDADKAFYEALNRLQYRGLIAKGEGDTPAQAIYQLLSPLNVRLSNYNRGTLFLLSVRRYGLFRAIQKLFADRSNIVSRVILNIVKQRPLTLHHIILCIGLGKTVDVSEKDLTQLEMSAESLKNFSWLRDIVINQTISLLNQYVVLLEGT